MNFLFIGTPEDKAYVGSLRKPIGVNSCRVKLTCPTTLYEITSDCKKYKIAGVITTSPQLLSKLAGRPKLKIDNFAGSYFTHDGIPYVIVDPLIHTVSVPHGKFLLDRFVSKLVHPKKWLASPEFKWRIIKNQADFTLAQEWLSGSKLIGLDIETFSHQASIRCVGYTGLKISQGGTLSTFSFVVPLIDDFSLGVVRSLNAIRVPKVTQNGKYDLSYLTRYDAVPWGWYWDTATMMHSWYCELPKDLASLQAFFVKDAIYWKDLADTTDLEQYYLYNAKDTWATVLVAWNWIKDAPSWARNNYLMEFPVNYPCHMCEMIGIGRDPVRLHEARLEVDKVIADKSIELNKILGTIDFNVNSPLQMKRLLKILGCGDLKTADDKALAKASFRHPLNARIISLIRGVPKSPDPELAGIRALRKIKSTYLRIDADANKKGEGGAKEFNGKILYSLVPHGTDSGRLASKEHHFWCGLQLQNIPSGGLVKSTLRAPEGFYIGESDLSQAETRDTAYITGDSNLIEAINCGKDFHSLNAAAFFGMKYEELYDDEHHKKLNPFLRNLAKHVNHGANYNMGAEVMVDTLGEKLLFEAAHRLKLPAKWTAKIIAQHLLDKFAERYPIVRHDYQQWVVATIVSTHMLVGATGWTRYCFSDPRTSKPMLNKYIAHSPQSLNAMVLNKAFMRVFYDMCMNPTIAPYFRLVGQIHDSILFFYAHGHDKLPQMVKERMEIPVTIKDIKGVERTFTVPADLKIGKPGHRATYWSETE